MSIRLRKKIEKEIVSHFDARTKRAHLGASVIGHSCARYIWYEATGAQAQALSPKQLITFEIGNYLEKMLVKFIAGAVYYSKTPQLFDKDYTFLGGTPDGVISYKTKHYILEIKTANAASFARLEKSNYQTWMKSYYIQVQCYMGWTNLDEAVVIVLNKDNSELYEEIISFDDTCFQQVREKANLIYHADTPPPRLSESPLWYECKMCKFNATCHQKNA